MSVHKLNPLVDKYFFLMHGEWRGKPMYTVCHVESLVSPGHFLVKSTVINSNMDQKPAVTKVVAARDIVGKQIFCSIDELHRFVGAL
jgi:hypothetical protein